MKIFAVLSFSLALIACGVQQNSLQMSTSSIQQNQDSLEQQHNSTPANELKVTNSKLARAKASFEEFVASLSEDDLEGGNCVGHSQRFAAKLASEGLSDLSLRILLIVREPNRGMPNPLVPHPAAVRGKPVRFWIWHAVVLMDGHIFDPKYINLVAPIEEYRNHMWPQLQTVNDAWIFPMTPNRMPEIVGSDYPGGPPKMLRFVPVSFNDVINNPKLEASKR